MRCIIWLKKSPARGCKNPSIEGEKKRISPTSSMKYISQQEKETLSIKMSVESHPVTRKFGKHDQLPNRESSLGGFESSPNVMVGQSVDSQRRHGTT